MTLAVRPMGHKLSTPADRLDGPIHGLNDVLFRAKSGTHVRERDLFSLFTLVYFILLKSVRELLPAHDAHIPTARTFRLGQRPGTMLLVDHYLSYSFYYHALFRSSANVSGSTSSSSTRCCNKRG